MALAFQARVLLPGSAEGPLLRLTEPVSFWGAVDPDRGTIVDRHHPQAGQSLAGRIVALPASRGSGGTPGALAELLRRGKGPLALLLGQPDANLVAGAQVANKLYGIACPVLLLGQADDERLPDAARIRVFESGAIEIMAGRHRRSPTMRPSCTG